MRTIVLATALLASLPCARTSSDFSALAQCAASWSSYDAFTSSAVIYVSSQNTTYFPVTTNITSGTGQVYTTSEGIPVASGSFTPTKVVQTVYTVTSWDPAESTITNDPAQFSATPSCPSIAPSDCSNLYVSYLSSLGISGNATVPLITPAPTNSPRCPEYYYRPFSSCSYFTEDVETCFLSGANVQVFYFPPKSDVQNGSITSQVIQSYAPGITFTSPSIYLSFDYLSAFSTIAATQSICTSCGWDGCSAVGVGGGNGLETRGTSIAGALLTLAPEDVSTLLVSYPQAQISSVVQQIAQGGPDFANLADDINYNNGFMARRLNLEHFQHPSPEDYYLRPEGAPGCNNSVPSPECSTIFEGMHRPILSLPSQVSLLQGAWSTCQPAIYGVYDPPRALTEESTVEGVSDYGVFTTIVPSHHHITTPPQPSTPWEAVAPPTHIPGTDHSILSDNLHSPTSTSANETPNSPTGTGTSIAAGLVEDHYAALVIALIGVMILL